MTRSLRQTFGHNGHTRLNAIVELSLVALCLQRLIWFGSAGLAFVVAGLPHVQYDSLAYLWRTSGVRLLPNYGSGIR